MEAFTEEDSSVLIYDPFPFLLYLYFRCATSLKPTLEFAGCILYSFPSNYITTPLIM